MVSSAAAQLLQQPYVNVLKLPDSAKSGDVRDTMVRHVNVILLLSLACDIVHCI
jgi:hypothetical protein